MQVKNRKLRLTGNKNVGNPASDSGVPSGAAEGRKVMYSVTGTLVSDMSF